MVNEQMLAGKWDELKGTIKQKWGKLTDDDVRSFSGNVDELVGRIQFKTGESRDAIERFLNDVTAESGKAFAGVRRKVQETASHVADGARHAGEQVRHGYEEAERVVHDRPGQSMLLCFGLGMLSGLGMALLLRGRSEPSRMSRCMNASENYGHHILDRLNSAVSDLKKSFH